VKPWSEYPAEYREAILQAAAKGSHDVHFRDKRAAFSYRMRVWWAAEDIGQQQDAPQALRDACEAVRWTGPHTAKDDSTYYVTGTTAPRPGITDADVVAAMVDTPPMAKWLKRGD
jgi:hypothetical protein